MAETSTTTKKKATKTVTLPRARKNEERDMFVGINGVNYIIPKGESIDVPDFVAAEIERSQEAERHMYNHMDELMEQVK